MVDWIRKFSSQSCKCGCGGFPRAGRLFIRGHNRKISDPETNKKISATLTRRYQDPSFHSAVMLKKIQSKESRLFIRHEEDVKPIIEDVKNIVEEIKVEDVKIKVEEIKVKRNISFIKRVLIRFKNKVMGLFGGNLFRRS